MAELSMDEAHRADQKVEREVREVADRLEALGRSHRLAGTWLGTDCFNLAPHLRHEAAAIVRVWD